jgi:hypothetical protein
MSEPKNSIVLRSSSRNADRVRNHNNDDDDDEAYRSLIAEVAKLPALCQHMIYKYLHNMYMKDLCREIIHNVVWVRLRSGNVYRYEFLTSTQKNYPVCPDSDTEQ